MVTLLSRLGCGRLRFRCRPGGNKVVAAINVGTHTSRVDRATLTGRRLPALQEGARTLRNPLI